LAAVLEEGARPVRDRGAEAALTFRRCRDRDAARIAADAISSRAVIGSASSSAPPRAAIAGTLNWMMAAWVDLSDGSAAYHSA